MFTSKGLQFPILFPFVGGYSWEGEFGGPMVVDGYTLDQFDVSPVKFVESVLKGISSYFQVSSLSLSVMILVSSQLIFLPSFNLHVPVYVRSK